MLKKTIIGLVCIAVVTLILKAYYSAPKLELGDVLLVNLHGESVKLDSYLDKTLVVNYWATWCPPCLEEFPHFEKAKQEFEASVNFVMVSDESIGEISNFASSKPYTFIYLKSEKAFGDYGIHSRPNTLIYNKSGELFKAITGELSYDELTNLLKEIK